MLKYWNFIYFYYWWWLRYNISFKQSLNKWVGILCIGKSIYVTFWYRYIYSVSDGSPRIFRTVPGLICDPIWTRFMVTSPWKAGDCRVWVTYRFRFAIRVLHSFRRNSFSILIRLCASYVPQNVASCWASVPSGKRESFAHRPRIMRNCV